MAIDFSKLLSLDTKQRLNREAATRAYYRALTNAELASEASYYLGNCSRDGLASGQMGDHYDATMRHAVLPELMRRVAVAGGEGDCPHCETRHPAPSKFKQHATMFCPPERGGDRHVAPHPWARWSAEQLTDTSAENWDTDRLWIVQREKFCWRVERLTRSRVELDETGKVNQVLWAVPFIAPYPSVHTWACLNG